MTFGSRTRRGLAILAMVALCGCHAMPVARIAPTPNRPESTLATAGRAALLPATVAMDPPSEMSSIEPVRIAPGSLTPAEPTAEPSPPTPLLDAALERAKGLDEIIVNEMAKPATQPMPSPVTIVPTPTPAASNQIQLPPANPPKAEPVSVAPTMTPVAAPEPVKPRPREPEPEPARPEDLWREGVRRLGSLARAKLEQSNAPSPWGLRARVLAWLAEPDIDPEAGQRESDGVRTVLRALDEPSVESRRRGDELRSAILVLEDKAPLEIVDLRLCSKVDGFGEFDPFEPPVRKAGQAVIVYCEVDGLRFEQTSAGFRTRLSAQFEILAEGGGLPILTKPLEIAEETSRRRRRDYYVVYRLSLPKSLAPGDYRIRLTERDLTSDRSATREVNFAIAKD